MSDDTIVEVRARSDNDRELLAEVAGRLLDLDPGDVAVAQLCPNCGGSDHGQPSATDRARTARVYLSLGRAGDLVVVAGRLDGPVGVDIELLERVASAGFDDVAFTAAERVAIGVSTAPDLLRAQFWTAKEALLKATGTGLRTDPRLVELNEGPVLASWASSEIPLPEFRTGQFRTGHFQVGDVRLRSWEPSPGYLVSVAEINSGTGTR